MVNDRLCRQPPALKQYEITLQSARQVLASLLAQPAKPWICFSGLVEDIARQAGLLKDRSAACRIQRIFRRHLAANLASRSDASPSSRHKAPEVPQPRAVPAAPAAAPAAAAVLQLTPPKPKLLRTEAVAVVARPPPTPATSSVLPPLYGLKDAAPGGALNPIERRRLLVASQLAARNPGRLARSRRGMLAAQCRGAGVAGAELPAPPSTAPSWPMEGGLTDERAAGFRADSLGLGQTAPLTGLGGGMRYPESPRLRGDLEPLIQPATPRVAPRPPAPSGPSAPVPSMAGSRGGGREGDRLLKDSADDDPGSACGGGRDVPGCGFTAGFSLGPPPARPELRIKAAPTSVGTAAPSLATTPRGGFVASFRGSASSRGPSPLGTPRALGPGSSAIFALEGAQSGVPRFRPQAAAAY